MRTIQSYYLTEVEVGSQLGIDYSALPEGMIKEQIKDLLKDAIACAEDFCGMTLTDTKLTEEVSFEYGATTIEATNVRNGSLVVKDEEGNTVDSSSYNAFTAYNKVIIELIDIEDFKGTIELEEGYRIGEVPRGVRRGTLIMAKDLFNEDSGSYTEGATVKATNAAARYLGAHSISFK